MRPEAPQQLTAADLLNPAWVRHLLEQRLLPVAAQLLWMGSLKGTMLYLPDQPVPEGASVERSRHGVFGVVSPLGEKITTYALFLPTKQMNCFRDLVTEAKQAVDKR